jgi:hypothetical protein
MDLKTRRVGVVGGDDQWEENRMKRQLWSMLILALTGGFLGGAAASWLLAVQPVFAERDYGSGRLIVAEELRIVDSYGNTRITLGSSTEEGDPQLVLVGKEGSQARLAVTYGKPGLELESGLGRVMLGMEKRLPKLSLRYGGRSRELTIPEGRP